MIEELSGWALKFLIVIILAQVVFHLSLEVAMLLFKDYLDLKHPQESKKRRRILT